MKLLLDLTYEDVCRLKAFSKGVNNFNGKRNNWKVNAYELLMGTLENGDLIFSGEEGQKIYQKELYKLLAKGKKNYDTTTDAISY